MEVRSVVLYNTARLYAGHHTCSSCYLSYYVETEGVCVYGFLSNICLNGDFNKAR